MILFTIDLFSKHTIIYVIFVLLKLSPRALQKCAYLTNNITPLQDLYANIDPYYSASLPPC